MRLWGPPVLGSLAQGLQAHQAWGQVSGGRGAHQLVLLLHLGLLVLEPLVPLLQLGHQGLALLTQSLLVFDQLRPGAEVKLLPREARRPRLPSPGGASAPNPKTPRCSWVCAGPWVWEGVHTWTRGCSCPRPSSPLRPGWCQRSSGRGGALATSPPVWPHQELPGMGVILSTPSPGQWRRACPLPAKGSL